MNTTASSQVPAQQVQQVQQAQPPQPTGAMNFEDLNSRYTGPIPSARCNHGCVAMGKYFYVVGGRGEGTEQRYNDVHIMDVDTMEWKTTRAVGDLPPASSSFSLSVVNDAVYLFGGKTNDTFLNAMFYFKHRVNHDVVTGADDHIIEWREIRILGDQVPPAPRYLHSACVVGKKKLFIFGGSAPDDSCYNDLHIFNTRTATWLRFRTAGTAPPPRARHSCCVSGNRMYVIGGMDPIGRNLHDLYALNIDSLTWEKIETNLDSVPPIAGAAAFQFGSKLVMFGGLSDKHRPEGESTNDTYIFDALNCQWCKVGIPTTLPEVRNGHRGAVIPGTSRILFFGGWHCRFLGDLFVLDTHINDNFQCSYQTTTFNKQSAFFAYDSNRRRFSIFDVEIVHKSEQCANIARV